METAQGSEYVALMKNEEADIQVIVASESDLAAPEILVKSLSSRGPAKRIRDSNESNRRVAQEPNTLRLAGLRLCMGAPRTGR